MEHPIKKLIPFEEALDLVLSSVSRLDSVKVNLTESLNSVLAEDVYADRDMPPFDKSAMDGYACRKEDLGNELLIIEELPAGSVPSKIIAKNQCARIMTGAMVPDGADFVLMKEYAETAGSQMITCTGLSSSANICYQAEDLREGDLILKKGTLLKASHIAVLASVGTDCPSVVKKPAVTIFSTGSELVEPSEKPQQQQIRNSNSYQLMAQLKSMDISALNSGIVKDEEEVIFQRMKEAIRNSDVVIISGGVSVGDYDFVPEILKRMGAQILLHGMNVKPGKHLLFATMGKKYIIGLPGNPVSSFVQFELLVKPFLLKLMGCDTRSTCLKMPVAEDYSRQKADNLLFVPVSFTDEGAAQSLEYHGSAHIHALSGADGIMEIPVGTNKIKKGDIVHVRPI